MKHTACTSCSVETVNACVAMTCDTCGADLAATDQQDLSAASTGKDGVYQAVPELAWEACSAVDSESIHRFLTVS